MLMPLAEGRALVLEACRPIEPCMVATREALGLAVARTTLAVHGAPRFPNSAMDGYAVRAVDVGSAPVVLPVVGTLSAGSDPAGVMVGEGQAVRIATGAPLPAGADAVVMVEWTSEGGETVCIERPVERGANVRLAGEDVDAGEAVVQPGTTLGPAHLGVLASTGVAAICVRARLRVGVIATGDELSEDWGDLRPGTIPDSNRPMLLALLGQAGCTSVDGGIVPDDKRLLAQAVEHQLRRCDALVTSGGVSVGERDHVAEVVAALGTVHELRLAIKPSKPLAFGMVGGKPVFGLPGNPVSSLVSFELFVRPAVLQMMGHGRTDRPRVMARVQERFARRPDGKTHLMRAVVEYEPDSGFVARPAGPQGSHQLRAAACANALVVVPDGPGAGPDETVEAVLLSWG